MSNQLTTDRTVVADDDILASDYNNARTDLHSVAEGFYDAGTPDLPLAMQVAGVHWSDPTSKAFRFFRQTATGADARSKSSPLRPTWHYNDQTGDPADDARVAEGDLLVYDDGTNSRFLKACKNVGGVRSFYGLGVRADNRTTATSGAGASQNSDRVAARSQIFQGSTQWREWFFRSEDVDNAGSFASFMAFRFQVQGSSDLLEAWRISKSRAWLNGSDLCVDDMTWESRQTSIQLGLGTIVDGFAGSVRTGGGYHTDAVTRHNHIDLPNVQTASGSTVADSCVLRFPVAAGTHKALDSLSAGAKWLKVNEAGNVRYIPVLDSKSIPFASGVAYAEISTQDGEGTQTLTDPAVWYTVNQWLTDGLGVNATANAAGGSLVVVADGDYQVTATLSVQPAAAETYVLRIAHIAGPSSTTTIAEAFVVSASADVVSVAMHGLATLAAGDEVEVQVQNKNTGATAFVLAAGNFSFERKR